MPFTPDDFYVGMIAYFTVNDLRKNKRIRSTTDSRDAKPRPFVCFAEHEGEAYWTHFTTKHKNWRRTIDHKDLCYPQGRFKVEDDLIISDGLTTFAGPIEVFAKRSQRFDEFEGFQRPFLTKEGVEHVRKIVEVRGGQLPPVGAQSTALLAA